MRGCCRHSHDAWSRLTLTNHCREKSTSALEKRTHLLNHSVILGNLSITVLQLCECVFFFSFFGVRQLKITNDSNCTAAETEEGLQDQSIPQSLCKSNINQEAAKLIWLLSSVRQSIQTSLICQSFISPNFCLIKFVCSLYSITTWVALMKCSPVSPQINVSPSHASNVKALLSPEGINVSYTFHMHISLHFYRFGKRDN